MEHDPDFEAVKLVSSDIDKQGVIRAIDGWCRYENAEAAGHGPLSSWFEDFTARSRSEILKPAFWCEQAPELHVIAVKYFGDQFDVSYLLQLIHHLNVLVRWWASYHLAHIDMKFDLRMDVPNRGLMGAMTQLQGSRIREQVLEVIVRQALAGAPWREITAGPMSANRIDHCEVYKELIRRRGRDLEFGIGLRHVSVPERTEKSLSSAQHAEMWRSICRNAAELVTIDPSSLQAQGGTPDLLRRAKLVMDSVANVKVPDGHDEQSTVQRWRTNVTSTATNRPSAERAMQEWYRIWRQPAPVEIIWFESPVDGLVAAAEKLDRLCGSDDSMVGLLDKLAFWMRSPSINMPIGHNANLNNPLLLAQWERLRLAEFSFVSADPAPFRQLARLRNRVSEILIEALRLRSERARGPLSKKVDQIMRLWLGGLFEADWLSAVELRASLDEGGPFWRTLVDIADSCGFWLAFEDCVIATDKPTAIHLDDQLRFHNSSGPALAFGDLKFFFMQGVAVPPAVVLEPEKITVESIDQEANLEVRRVMLERFGTGRFVSEAGAEVIDHCGDQILYRREMQNDEPLVMVKVINSTAEPDGTFKEYFLRVPPTVFTVRDAIAWTFGIRGDAYAPDVET